jgi:hypothetical protein
LSGSLSSVPKTSCFRSSQPLTRTHIHSPTPVASLANSTLTKSSRQKKQKQQPSSTEKHTDTPAKQFGASTRTRVAAVRTQALDGMFAECVFTEGELMATARTDDGIEVEWTSSSVGTDALDAALNRSVYASVEADDEARKKACSIYRLAPYVNNE